MRLWNIGEVFGSKAVLDQFAVVLLVANDDGARVDLDDLTSYAEVLDHDVIAVSKL